MAYNTKSIITDKDGNPISQYYNSATDQYEPVQGAGGGNRVIVYKSDGTESSVSLLPILEKLEQLTGTVIDEATRKNSELQRVALYNQIATFDTEHETAPLGSELVSSTGWITTGWTGDFATGFTHTTGNTSPLTFPIGAVAGKLYQVELTVDDTDTMNSGFKFSVTIGDSEQFQMYQGTGATIRYSKGIKAINNGDLKIIPNSDFTGKVYNVSVKEVIGTIPPTTQIKDKHENVVFEARPTKSDLNNIFMGKNSGKSNTSGFENTIIGNDAMSNSVSGFWNSALGYKALANNINGSRSIAVGHRALEGMISGHRNIALGTFALHRITTGAYNIGIGADSAWYTTTGNYNIAIGTVSLDKNTTGSGNIAIGYNALRDNVDTSYNVAIGHWALRENKAHNNTAIGSRALSKNTTADGNTALGYEALREISTGGRNTALGQWAGSTTNGSRNVFVGRRAGTNMTSGNDNIIIGNETALGLLSGSSNILIGSNISFDNISRANYLNIGNLLYGELGAKKIGINITDPTARLHLGGGTVGTPVIKLEAGVLLTYPGSHRGGFEYDGIDLYFIKGDGTRVNLTGGLQ